MQGWLLLSKNLNIYRVGLHHHLHPLLPYLLSVSQEDQTAVRTAEKLLKEVRPKSPLAERKVLVMENYTLLATKSKQNAERALEIFMEMASTEVKCLHALILWNRVFKHLYSDVV